MPPLLRPLALAFALATLAVTSAAEAAFDLSGAWLVTSPAGEPFLNTNFEFSQSAGIVQTSGGSWQGAIDEGTGSFHLQYNAWFSCVSEWTIDGTMAADGRTFTATARYGELSGDGCATKELCREVTQSITGSRCGNNVIDPWEECDFGDAVDGDCCSSTCTLQPVGDACTSDANECTADVCGVDGRCSHLPVAGSCSDPHGCNQGECTAGECVPTQYSPAGSSCDRDSSVCTIDTCDGAGSCKAGDNLECGPCGQCDGTQGCVRRRRFFYCGDDTPCQTGLFDSADLLLRVGRNPAQSRVRVNLHVDSASGSSPDFDLGDPDLGDTHYMMCVYADDGAVSRPVFHARIPAGGTCGDKDCWRSAYRPDTVFQQYLYHDDSGAFYGVNRVVALSDSSFQFVGRGENLPLPASLNAGSNWTAVLVKDPFDLPRRCWEQPVSTVRESSRFLRGEFRAP